MQMSGHICVGSRIVSMWLNSGDGPEASFSALQVKILESKIRNTNINDMLGELEGAGFLLKSKRYSQNQI